MKKSSIYAILAALLLAVVALLFFFPDDVRGNVLQQSDMQQGMANGQEGKLFHEQTGETTRWTNSLFSGMPNFQIAPSYASSDLLDWVAKVYTLWLPSPANLLFAMMLGFFLMCLCMKMKWYYAVFGALAWGFSTYFIILIGAGHIWKFETLAFIPPTIGGIVLCYRGRYLGGAAMASLFGALQLQSNHPQMSYYFMFVIFAMVVAWLVKGIRSDNRSKELKQWGIATACVLGAGIVAVGANATSLWNSYQYSKETIRGRATELSTGADAAGASTGLSKEYITGWSYGIDETLTLLIPNVKGGATVKPEKGNNELMTLDRTDKAMSDYYGQESQILASFPQYFGAQPMTNGPVYVGAFVLLLAVLALLVVQGPMKWALFGVGLLAILLSWGHNFMPLTDFFIDYFPGYNKFRTVSSILVIVEFTIPLLAVMCLHRIVTDPEFYAGNKWSFIGVFGGGAFICLLGAIAPGIFGSTFTTEELSQLQSMGLLGNPEFAPILDAISQTRLSLVSADSLRSLIFIAIAFGVMMLYFKRVFTQPAILVGCLSVVMLLDLFAINKRYVNTDSFVEPEAATAFVPTSADKQILADTAQNYRVLDIAGFDSPRTSYFHKAVGGYHAAKLTRYNDLIDKQIKTGNQRVIDMLNARYILNADTVVTNTGAMGNAWFVDKVAFVDGADAEMKSLDNLDVATTAVSDRKFSGMLSGAAAKAPGDTIFETTYAPNRLTYHSHAAGPRVAVFSEVYFPWGWQATVNGQPAEIGRVNYVLRAIKVPAGDSTIEFRFNPQSVERAEGISVVSIIIIYVLIVAALIVVSLPQMRRRKGSASGKENNEERVRTINLDKK